MSKTTDPTGRRGKRTAYAELIGMKPGPRSKPSERKDRARPINGHDEPRDALQNDASELLVLHSDDQIAVAFVEAAADRLRWSPGLGWMMDDGVVWSRDDRRARFTVARQTCRAAAASVVGRDAERKRITSAKTVAAVVALAETDPRIQVASDAWDNAPLELNTPAGIVDLQTGQVRRRGLAYVTKATAVAPDFTAPRPRFEQFLAEVFAEDEDLIEFMQRAFGYCLTGDVREQILLFAHGVGSNGKSTLIDLMLWLWGDYGIKVPASALMKHRGDQHPTAIAQLRGRRLAVASELAEGDHFDEQLLKDLTGTERMTARYMRQDYFEFDQTQKHIIVGNYRPRLKGGDPAMARRLLLVPFDVTFAGEHKDPTLKDKLRAEAPAILAWAIRGAAKWLEYGLNVPESVRSVSAEYMADMDDLALWIAERCTRVGECKASELYASFTDWKRERNEVPQSMTGWTERVKRVPGVDKRRSTGGVAVYSGLALKRDELERVRAEAERANGRRLF